MAGLCWSVLLSHESHPKSIENFRVNIQSLFALHLAERAGAGFVTTGRKHTTRFRKTNAVSTWLPPPPRESTVPCTKKSSIATQPKQGLRRCSSDTYLIQYIMILISYMALPVRASMNDSNCSSRCVLVCLLKNEVHDHVHKTTSCFTILHKSVYSRFMYYATPQIGISIQSRP